MATMIDSNEMLNDFRYLPSNDGTFGMYNGSPVHQSNGNYAMPRDPRADNRNRMAMTAINGSINNELDILHNAFRVMRTNVSMLADLITEVEKMQDNRAYSVMAMRNNNVNDRFRFDGGNRFREMQDCQFYEELVDLDYLDSQKLKSVLARISEKSIKNK